MAVICGREKWSRQYCSLSLRVSPALFPFFFAPLPPIPSPELLVVMAVMTEKTKRREIVEMGGKFRKGAGGKDC